MTTPTGPSPALFFDTVFAYQRTAALKAAIELELFTAIDEGAHTVPAIAKRCKASVILISGCQDNQTSMDGDHNGAFTEQLLRVWDDGSFEGNYAQLHAAIKARMPRTQVPNLFTLGRAGRFLAARPFKV